jgi:hypothetical protein
MSGDSTQQGQQQPQQRRAPNIPAFTVEFADLKNSGLMSIDTLRIREGMRPAWTKSNFFRKGSGADIGDMARMPDIPGVRLTVDPRKSTLLIHDPLSDDKELCQQIKRVLEGGEDYITMRIVGSENFRPTPDATHKLDDDELKTVMLEIARKTYAPEDVRTMVAVNGSHVPTEEELADFPGDELFDPWNSNEDKPRYVKDVKAWRRRINAQSAAV